MFLRVFSTHLFLTYVLFVLLFLYIVSNWVLSKCKFIFFGQMGRLQEMVYTNDLSIVNQKPCQAKTASVVQWFINKINQKLNQDCQDCKRHRPCIFQSNAVKSTSIYKILYLPRTSLLSIASGHFLIFFCHSTSMLNVELKVFENFNFMLLKLLVCDVHLYLFNLICFIIIILLLLVKPYLSLY